LIFSFWASFILILKARWVGCDFYIIMTDPPFNNFWASVLLKKRSYALWTMDLYPEAFEAKGLIRSENALNELYKYTLSKSEPAFILALGQGQKDHILKNTDDLEVLVIPVGLASHLEKTSINSPVWYNKEKLTFAYVGNIGEAHDEAFIIDFIKALDREKHHFVLSTYGTKSNHLIKKVALHDHVSIVKHVADEDLSFIDVQIVTLLTSWTHICVPSKALYGLSSGSAIVFNGSPLSDTWQYVQKCGWIVSDNYKQTEEIKSLVDGLSLDRINEKRKHIISVLEELEKEMNETLLNIGNKIKTKYES
jgi:hypothetical protein